MRTRLAITDLTRMQAGRVCIAGYDQHGRCIRPVLPPPGIMEQSLFVNNNLIIYPFSMVEYDLVRPISKPPHTEDYSYDPTTVRYVKRLDEGERREILNKSLSKSVEEIFGQPIRTGPGHFVLDGQGSRSLGTIRPNRIIKAIYEQESGGSIRYRLGFEDDAKDIYWLSVADLTWRYYCDFQRRKGLPYQKIGNALTGLFLSNEVYIRIGLARSWAKYPERCYLQVTGIYSFPDYLEGKLFSDFYIKE
ncbi:MAG: dual OB domain-containing protein [Anaerolineales bacterium]